MKPPPDMRPGGRCLQATRGTVCAGWCEDPRGYVTRIAPILRRHGLAPGLAGRLAAAGFSVSVVCVTSDGLG